MLQVDTVEQKLYGVKYFVRQVRVELALLFENSDSQDRLTPFKDNGPADSTHTDHLLFFTTQLVTKLLSQELLQLFLRASYVYHYVERVGPVVY